MLAQYGLSCLGRSRDCSRSWLPYSRPEGLRIRYADFTALEKRPNILL